ncbi:MAG: M16 family metallopeptidase [Blastocatellia bacterium]
MFTGILCLAVMGALAAPALAQKDKDKEKKKKGDSVAPVAPAPPTPFSEVRRDSLLNGLQIVSLARPGGGRLRCDMVLRSGAMFDLVYKNGLARLTQESLLAANPNLKGELESLEAKMDWGVTLDQTWFRIESPTKNFATVMEIIGRLLVVETVRQDAFRLAQKNLLEQRKAAVAATPAELADNRFHEELYGSHPYAHDAEGTEKSVGNIVWADTFDFYRRFYIANNIVAVVTGDMRQENIIPVFKAFFGSWVKAAVVPMTFRQPDRVTALKLVRMEVPELPLVELRGGVPGLREKDTDFALTQLLARVLESRLKREAPGIGNIQAMAPARALPGPFYFTAAVSAERAQEFSRKATDTVAGLASMTATDIELNEAKDKLIADFNAMPVEDQLREMELKGLARTHPLTYVERVKSATAADLQRIARRLLDANALTVVVVGRVGEQFKTGLD